MRDAKYQYECRDCGHIYDVYHGPRDRVTLFCEFCMDKGGNYIHAPCKPIFKLPIVVVDGNDWRRLS